MDLRSLIAKMDAIEQGLNEAFNIKNVQAAVGSISDANQRHVQVAALAAQNGLPGLYDPVDGQYVSNTGSVSSTADKDTDYKLASMGLVPKNASTSTTLGRLFGTSGDEYDKNLRSQSDKVVADQTSAEFKQKKFAELQDLMKQLGALKKVDAPAATPAASATPSTTVAPATPSGQGATPAQSVVQNSNGTFTLTKKDGTKFNISADGKVVKEMKDISIANTLVESFGYQLDESPAAAAAPAAAPSVAGELGKTAAVAAGGAAAGKLASKVLGRAIPGVGTALSAKDAYDRWQAGDRTGAVISTLAGIGWLVPGPAGWMIGGALDAANLGRDFAGHTDQGATPAAPANPAAPKGDPKIIALQKYLKGQGADLGATGPAKDGVDGLMGPKTRAAMDKANLSESQRMAILMLQLETLNEAIPGAGLLKSLKGAPTVGKEVTTAAGDTYRWLGAQWAKVNPATGKASQIAAKDVAQELNSMSHGVKAIPGAVKNAIKANPIKAGAAAAAAGGATGYMMGGDEEGADTASATGTGGGHSGTGTAPSNQAATPEQVCSPEQVALIGKIKGVMGELSDVADSDPALAQVMQTYQQQIDALKCGDGSNGQGATPANDGKTPLERYYDSVGTKKDAPTKTSSNW